MLNTWLRFCFFTLFSFATSLFAQTVPLDVEQIDFILEEDATKIDETCYQVTPDKLNRLGRIWFPDPIDIKHDFLLDLNVFLGCKDEGADGFLFIFNQKPILGRRGPAMGKPSLGIELDTYYNAGLGDQEPDHIAILENGHFNHRKMSIAPFLLDKDIENCQYHQLLIEWKAQEQLLQISFDEEVVLTYKNSLKDLFKADSGVYWGLAASTGKGQNTHKVCFDRINVSPFENKIHAFSSNEMEQLKQGDVLALDKIAYLNGKLHLTSATKIELDKIVNLLKAHPSKKLDVYSHVHELENDTSNKVASKKRAQAIKRYLIQKGIDRDRIQAKGIGNLFPANKNSTRVEIYLFEPLP